MNVKDCVLDRLEELGMEDSLEYEDIIGMQDWKVKSWLDSGKFEGLLG